MKIKGAQISYFVFTGLLVLSFGLFVAAEDASVSAKNIFSDTDQDGLSNEEELAYGTDVNNKDTDNDGYSDGAEIKSGYDPLKPAPGDKLTNQVVEGQRDYSAESIPVQDLDAGSDSGVATVSPVEQNLTQALSDEVITLVQSKKTLSIADLDAIVNETINKEVSVDDIPEIDTSNIKIKVQDYSELPDEERMAREKEDALKYLTAVAYIMANNSPQKFSSEQDLQAMSKDFLGQTATLMSSFSNVAYFEQLETKGQDVLEQLSLVEVPEKLVPLHIEGLQLASYGLSAKDKLRKNPVDPVSSIVSFSEVRNFMVLSMNFMQEVTGEFEKLGITNIPIEL